MSILLRLLQAVAGPKLTTWCVGALAGLGGVVALLVARHKGRAEGRAEILQRNARADARQRAELARIRHKQMRAATNTPDDDELDRILEEGKF